MALDRGITLKDWLQEDRFASSVLAMAGEVLALLVVLHASGHVHRDLKPDNLLFIFHNQKWCLLDFGIVASTGVLPMITSTSARCVQGLSSVFESSPYAQISTNGSLGTKRLLWLQCPVTMSSMPRYCSSNACIEWFPLL
jgi:serine/threonine protein kinase